MNNELLFHASEMLVISYEISIFGYEEITSPASLAAEMERDHARCARQRRDETSRLSINYYRVNGSYQRYRNEERVLLTCLIYFAAYIYERLDA